MSSSATSRARKYLPEGVSQRSAQTRLESSPRSRPTSSPSTRLPSDRTFEPGKIILNVLVSVFLGTLLGIGAALMLELGNRRVRSAEDLARALDLPVLASLSGSESSTASRGAFFRRKANAGTAA